MPGAKRKSLAWRQTRLVVPGLAALVLAGGIALHSAIKSLLFSQFDQTLLAKARTLTRLPGEERTGINLGFTEDPLPEFQPGDNAEYFQVWLHNGGVLAKSPSLGQDRELPRKSSSGISTEFLPLTLPDGRPGRAVALRLGSQGGGGREDFFVDLTLARSSEDLNNILRQVVLGVVGGGAVLLLLAWVVVRRATNSALRPVDELASQVGKIDADSLASRVRIQGLPIDLQPIGEQINDLMGRLDAAFARERRFASNAAHELLTPVSELRVAADNALDWPDDDRATAGLAKDACELSAQMEHIVRSLLSLSRAEAHLTPLNIESFDLAETMRELLDSREDEIASRGLKLESELPEKLELRSDVVIVRSILNNLLANAVEYSTAGTTLRISAHLGQDTAEVSIRNRAEEISRDEVERFTEAFWRGDNIRNSRDHAGLGLALSRAFAQLLGGELRFELQDDKVVIGRVRIPSAAKKAG